MEKKSEFEDLSDIQKKLFNSFSGKDYKDNSIQGKFLTDKPYDEDWELSTWHFAFEFHKDTGFLYCVLNHRMTNNRTFCWDYSGKELSSENIHLVYPIQNFFIEVK